MENIIIIIIIMHGNNSREVYNQERVMMVGQRFIALRWIHFLIGPSDSPKTLKKSQNHLIYFNSALQMDQIFFILSPWGDFWVLNPFFLVRNTNRPGSNPNKLRTK